MKAVNFSEMLGTGCNTEWHYNPDDNILMFRARKISYTIPTFAIIFSMEIMVKSASCGTRESCVSISPYSISLAAEVFDCRCNSSKQVHSLAVQQKVH
jgi:hypothetical protein